MIDMSNYFFFHFLLFLRFGSTSFFTGSGFVLVNECDLIVIDISHFANSYSLHQINRWVYGVSREQKQMNTYCQNVIRVHAVSLAGRGEDQKTVKFFCVGHG